MTVTNHAGIGAVVALIIKEPQLALPLAFLSHFVLDSIPHFGYEKDGFGEVLKHKLSYIVIGLDIIGVVILFYLIKNNNLAIICSIIAVSPDFIWMIRYFFFERVGVFKPGEKMDLFSKFHAKIQWFERPTGLSIEVPLAFILLFMIGLNK